LAVVPVLVPLLCAEPLTPPELDDCALFAVVPVLVPVLCVEPLTPPPELCVLWVLLAVVPVLVPVLGADVESPPLLS